MTMTRTIYGTTQLSRRTILKSGGAGAFSLTFPVMARAQSAGTIKIGFVTPATGPLSLFGETDGFAVAQIEALLADGLDVGGQKYDVEILERDAQSDPNKAAERVGDLILNDGIHLMIPASTTDVINPVADQAELNEVPCISTASPWQAFVMPRGGAEKPFNWTYHFFWGLEDALGTFVGLWNSIETNKTVGMLFPQNADGETWGNTDYGLPVPTLAAGYEVTTPGYVQPRTNDFTAQIAEFKAAGCDIIGGITCPDDLKTFVTQANQQGYKPKAVTVAAALLFPSGIEAMGPLGNGMSSEVWWTPAHPFKSSLTGKTGRELADQWETETGRQSTQPLGYSHAIWEVALAILKRSSNPLDRVANRDAMVATDLNTLVGPIKFGAGPHQNICKTPVFGGQWVTGEKFTYDLKIVDNSVSDLMEPEQPMALISW